MAKTAAVPVTPQPIAIVEAEFLGVERESKNYIVLPGTLPVEAGKSAILIGNDGKVYLHKAIVAKVGGIPAGARITLVVEVEK